MILELLKRAMLANLKGSRGFLIDGFPRDEDQVEDFEREVRSEGSNVNRIGWLRVEFEKRK